MAITVQTCGGELFVDDETMHRGAFCILSSLRPLYVGNAYRGDGKQIPLKPGRKARRKRHDWNQHTLEMLVIGDMDVDDQVSTNVEETLEENIFWLESNVFGIPDYSSNADTTRAAELVLPSGATMDGTVQFDAPVWGEEHKGFDSVSGIYTVGVFFTVVMTIVDGPLEYHALVG